MNNSMDSSSSIHHHQNWLGFSLSNHHHMNINITSPSSAPDPSNLYLFEAFNTTAPTHTTTTATATSSSGPKLEDFLGGCTTTTTTTTTNTTATTTTTTKTAQQHELCGQFSIETPVTATTTTNTATAVSDSTTSSELYDSELKTIAASFLRGFATTVDQQSSSTQKQQLLVQAEPAQKKTVDTFGQRTSIFRGVTRHRWTGRYEAHLWDNSCRREGQSRKGRQVYLGGYDKEEKAARAYDLAALKYWGPTTTTNFPVSNYERELEEMKHMTRQEFVASLRRKSSGFSRGASIYRGVTRHHQHGRWQARIGRVAGNKDLYLGTFSTQEEAAEAYDIAAIKFRGLNAVTNFDMSRYDVKSIANSNLPIGGISGGKSKNSSESASDSKSIDGSRSDDRDRDLSSASSVTFASQPATSTLSFAIPIKQDPSDYWTSILGYQNTSVKNTSSGIVTPSTLFQSSAGGPPFQSPTAFSMDFNANSSVNDNSNNSNNNGLLFNGGYIQQQHSVVNGIIGTSSSSSSNIPFATPLSALHSNNGSGGYDGNSSYGSSWIAQSLHSYQSAKPNLSVFQTPIFGME